MSFERFPVPPAVKVQKTVPGPALPVPPGTVIGRIPAASVKGGIALTAEEQRLISEARWHPGEPVRSIPRVPVTKSVQAQIDALYQKEQDITDMSPIDPGTMPLEPPVPVDINTLPPKERAAAEKMFAEMDALQDQMNARNLAKKKQAQVGGAPLRVPAAAQFTQEAAEAPEATVKASPFKLKTEPTVEFCSAEQNSEPPEVGGDLSGTTTYCPRCNFDLNKDVTAPSETDIVTYLKVVLDGGRFRKQVQLFGKRIQIIFRTLTPKEVDEALVEADREVAARNITNIMQYARLAEGFKLAMGIEAVIRNGETVKYPELSQIEPQGGVSAVRMLYDYFNNDVFTTDSLRRAVGRQWSQFNGIVQHMEAKADDPNFFGSGG